MKNCRILLAMIVLSVLQSYTPTQILNAILFIDTSTIFYTTFVDGNIMFDDNNRLQTKFGQGNVLDLSSILSTGEGWVQQSKGVR